MKTLTNRKGYGKDSDLTTSSLFISMIVDDYHLVIYILYSKESNYYLAKGYIFKTHSAKNITCLALFINSKYDTKYHH